jgi:hypothetical protein
MSSITNVTRTLNVKPTAILTVVLAVIAVLANPSGPLGGFWRPATEMHPPMGVELPFAILLKIAEALTFGLGISFLVFGYPTVRAISPASGRLTRATHLSIAWLLFSWWPHDSLHIHNGMNVGGLLAIEYAFHITLMIAGIILARFFLTLVRRPA